MLPLFLSETQSQALQNLTIPSFVRMLSSLLSKISVEALYYGNVDRSDADAAQSLLMNLITKSGGGGLPKKKYPQLNVTKIPLTSAPHLVTAPTRDPGDPNTCVEIYFQIGKDNIVEWVLIDLIAQMMHEPLYDQLRTKDQFGYEVSCDSRWTYGVMGMFFRVVTSTKSASETTDRIYLFIRNFRQELHDMTQDDFMEHLVGLAKNKLLISNSLEEECDQLWSEIRDFRYEWQIHRDETVCLRSVTKENVLAAYDDWLMPTCSGGKAREQRAIAVQVIGANDGQASVGRPLVDGSDVGEYTDEQVLAFLDLSKKATWGKIF